MMYHQATGMQREEALHLLYQVLPEGYWGDPHGGEILSCDGWKLPNSIRRGWHCILPAACLSSSLTHSQRKVT